MDCGIPINDLGAGSKNGVCLLFPFVLLVVPSGSGSTNGVPSEVNHGLQHFLSVFFRETIRFLGENSNFLHDNVSDQTDRDNHEGNAKGCFPFSGGGIHLSKSLTERSSVEGFLLFQCQVFPITLLFLLQGLQFLGNGTESDRWVWDHYSVHVPGLSIPSVANNFTVGEEVIVDLCYWTMTMGCCSSTVCCSLRFCLNHSFNS
uniref:Uncharacterized protein n=1 Tax=Cacopsylla melanoneura TaxID=428564 RepID=A0A8D8MCW4_9HEMI